MGYLTDSASGAFKKATKRSYVPPWYSVAGTVAVVIIAILIVVSLLFPGEKPKNAPGAASTPSASTSVPAETPSETPSETPTTVPTDTAEPTAPAAGSVVTVPTIDGQEAQVPQDAYTQAKLAAQGIFTGDFTNVRVAQGQSLPQVQGNPTATVVSVVLNSQAPSAITFTVTVNSDGLGTEKKLDVIVTPVQGSDLWAYYPTAL